MIHIKVNNDTLDLLTLSLGVEVSVSGYPDRILCGASVVQRALSKIEVITAITNIPVG